MTCNRIDRRALLVPLLLLAATLGLNCGTTVATPRQGWNERWGPLVPHKTFPTECKICHVPEGWDVIREDFSFDHEKETGFALEGAHRGAACLRCHNDFGPVQVYVARGCGGCHLDPHEGNLGGECARCHGQENWEPEGLIAEHARTRFPLVGAHAAVACELCHRRGPAGDFRGAPTRCELCHRQALASAVSPNHLANGWVTHCERCHRPTTWRGRGFIHAFPLTEGHAGLACTRCHVGGNFGPISADCYSCHQADYQRAPNHVANNFSRTCQSCHGVETWKGAVFDHPFPLTGGHAGLACTRCHVGGNFGPISADCYSCHQADYQRAPNHVANNFSRTCQNCHTVQTWQGAVFDHPFPLKGPHQVDCAVCHPGGTNTFTCLVCHQHSQTKMDRKHKDVAGYRYLSAACVQCHPDGKE
ncbi:MAG: hypothetical protein ACE5JG_11860 [Planctomycetota bacterium]